MQIDSQTGSQCTAGSSIVSALLMQIRICHDLCVASNLQRLQTAPAFLLTYVYVNDKTIEQEKIIMVCKLSEAGGMAPIRWRCQKHTQVAIIMLHNLRLRGINENRCQKERI